MKNPMLRLTRKMLNERNIIIYCVVGTVLFFSTMTFLIYQSYSILSHNKVDVNSDGYVTVQAKHDSLMDSFFMRLDSYFSGQNYNINKTSLPKIDYNNCSVLPLPYVPEKTNIYTNSQGFVVVSAYPAGGGYNVMKHYEKALSTCLDTKPVNNLNVTGFTVGEYSVFGLGDIVVYSKQANIDHIIDNIRSLLQDSKCVDLNVENTGRERNEYSFPETYKGLYKTDTVDVMSRVLDKSTLNFNIVPLNKYENVLLPLPEKLLEDKKTVDSLQTVSKPVEHKVDIQTSNSYKYRIRDLSGPGCGWDWHKMKPPIVEENSLLVEKTNAKKQALFDGEKNLNNSLNVLFYDSWENIFLAPILDEQNRKTLKANIIIDQLKELNNRRQAYRNVWVEYLENTQKYYENVEKKKRLIEDYDNSMKQCLAHQQAQNARLNRLSVRTQNNNIKCDLDKPVFNVGEKPVRPTVFDENTPVPFDWEKEEEKILQSYNIQ